MAENKTKATGLSPEKYLAAITDESRRNDCIALAKLMAKASKQPAVMWGSSIVGFGTHTYALAGGREGQICAVGFSSRKGDISVYGIAGENADASLFAKLGKYKGGKGCVYIARLGDIDLKVLEKLVADAARRKSD